MTKNETAAGAAKTADREIFLSEILSLPVMLKGKKIGALSDLIIVETTLIPEVKSLYVKRSFGYPSLIIPWENIQELAEHRIDIDIPGLEAYEGTPPEDALLLKDYVMDKKVLDLEESEVEVVYDIRLVLRNKKLYVTDVDTGKSARLRRFGLGRLTKIVSSDAKDDQMISWTYIQPLPTNIGSFKGDVKLKVLKENLAEIHPVDLADILEELDHDQRVAVFTSLENEHASDTLEEIEPNVQRDIIASLDIAKVVPLITTMTSGQAADVLSAIPHSQAEDILEAISPEMAKKVRAIMERQEEKVIHYTTQKILKFLPETLVEYVQNDYPNHARGKDVIMYIYVVDKSEHLLGVVDLKELLIADDKSSLAAIMAENVITLNTDSTLKDASREFERYGFRALPVTDDENRLVGAIPYRDVMDLTHHFLE
ncbi:magnesium transporter MgtE N-terminal domain-containing protein [Methanoregula sp.]|uniref:magnesium transporter MgtE N-terminal domain-containing protein n=1 Tax=Methanoregula sp. TaxID=2052170 RepID=UPI003BAFAE7F